MIDREERAPTTSEQAEIAAVISQLEKARRALPEAALPAFARLEIETDRGRREYLLGPRSAIGRELNVLDWRRAPLAEVFFAFEAGEDFELEEPPVKGTVLGRSLLAFQGAELVGILKPGHEQLRKAEGEWRVSDAPQRQHLPRRSAEARARAQQLGAVPLDAAQRQAVELPDQRSLLVLGEAGFGKTTVALHRMARLEGAARAAGRTWNGLVIVPTRGLERLSKLMLERLSVRGVEVATYDDWVRAQARRAFPELPQRDSKNSTAAIIRLKRHPALREVLPELARRKQGKRNSALKHARRIDLLHLFGDRDLIARVIDRAGLPAHTSEELLEHSQLQFEKPSERVFAHVDADRLQTLDGAAIDQGTPLEDAHSIDVEDCAVMFELERLRSGADASPKGHFRRYDQIIVDEAQELAPIELAVIGRARAPGGSITVAGDDQQQIDDTACFPGWDAVMRELGLADHQRVVLTESYRCPPEVTAYARGVVGRGPPISIAAIGAGPLRFSEVPDPCHRSCLLIEQLRRFEAEDPTATIAVIARTPESAQTIEAELKRGLATRLALGGDFDFRPGVVVTAVEEVKGLEFDLVVLPDAEPINAATTPAARRAMYLALTRALHGAWILHPSVQARAS